MRKTMFAALSAVVIASAIPAQAQTSTTGAGTLSASEWNELRDTRIAVVKAALQLRPDQQQFWPAIENAIRARSEARQRRIADIRARMEKPAEMDPVEFVKFRADVLAQRADGLKKLADAWQPLYATLDQGQKRRMRVLAVLVLREVRDAIETHRAQADDEDMDDEY